MALPDGTRRRFAALRAWQRGPGDICERIILANGNPSSAG